MKVLFLDIDGVLNNHSVMDNNFCGIQADKVKLVNDIIQSTNCNIIISSAWRYMVTYGSMTLKGFENLLLTHGLDVYNKILDVTVADEDSASRGVQISRAIAKHRIDRYAIVDDLDLDISRIHGDKFIKTNPSIGITKKEVEKIKEILI